MLFSPQKTTNAAVDNYFAALRRLESAEVRHQSTLDDLDQAIEARIPDRITRAWLAVRDSENELKRARGDSVEAHQAYWRGRLAAMAPEVRPVAKLQPPIQPHRLPCRRFATESRRDENCRVPCRRRRR